MKIEPIGGRAPQRLSRRNALAIFAIGVGVSFVIGLLDLHRWSPLARLDNVFLDAFLLHSSADRPSTGTIVIDIDDYSLAAVGQWPWPRYRVASLIERIAARRPAAIGMDVLFPEPDRSSPDTIRETYRRDFGLDVAVTGVPDGLRDNDGYLGDTIARTGVVASDYLYFDHTTKPAPSRTGLVFDGRTDLLSLDVATGILSNADAIATQTRTTGFVNNGADEDGVLRRLPLLLRHEGVIHANLSLATVMRSLGVSTATIESDADGLAIRVGPHRVPIDPSGFATVRFNAKPRSYRSISAVDVLNGEFDATQLAGRIVFIGSSAVGLNDLHATALDARFPGLKVQAVMAQNILDDDFVQTPSWAPPTTFAACLAAGLVMSTMFVAVGGVYGAVVGSLLAICTVVLASVLPFVRAGLYVSPAAPIVVVLTLFVLFFVTRFAIEKRRAYVWHRQLENARQVTMESMASVAETRDPETGAHIKRTQHYVRAIAEQLQRTGHHRAMLTKEYIDLLFLSAPLHDIGKVGVPDHILLKPGRLTDDEFVLMKEHAEFGRKIIFSTSQRIDGDNFLIVAGEIAATHHEKWDGTGYPRGLAGEAIPLSGRIMAAADIYDALISRRCYKEPFSHERATALMRESHGTIFDPVVLDAFFGIEDEIRAIAFRFKDESDGHAPAVEEWRELGLEPLGESPTTA